MFKSRTKIALFMLWAVLCVPTALLLGLEAVSKYNRATNSIIGAMAANEDAGGDAYNNKSIATEMQNEILMEGALLALGGGALLALPLIVKAVVVIKRRQIRMAGGSQRGSKIPTAFTRFLPIASAPGFKIAGIALLLLLGGVVYFFVADPGITREARASVAARLLDPESAKFREVRVVRNAVCGQVNGKNRMGGYTGFSDFVYYKGSVAIDDGEDESDSEQKMIIRRICSE